MESKSSKSSKSIEPKESSRTFRVKPSDFETRGDSDENRKRGKIWKQDQTCTVTKSKAECQNEARIYTALKQDANYAGAYVDEEKKQVTTKIGNRVELTSVPVIQEVLRALQKLHTRNVTHGDLKPAHILRDSLGSIFFIDFGYSGLNSDNLMAAKGFTTKWTSFDAILDCKMHELDDYEAVFTSALFEICALLGRNDLPTEPPKDTKSLKRWAAWKLQLMDHVYTLYEQQQSSSSSSNPLSFALGFVARGLVGVWTLPRKTKRLSESERNNLVDLTKVDFKKHSAGIRALFLGHLGRKQGDKRLDVPLDVHRKVCLRPDGTVEPSHSSELATQKQVVRLFSKLNPRAKDYPSVVCWPTRLSRKSPAEPTEGATDDKNAWAEYDCLIVNETPAPWVYGDDWDFLGKGEEYGEYGVKLLHAISGKYLYVEDTHDNKHIFHFLTKFERFVRRYTLRPLDILHLVIGIYIECHEKDFFPRNFVIMLDVVQHKEWKCQQCFKNDLRALSHYFYCNDCRKYFCLECDINEQCSDHSKVEFETKSMGVEGILPSLSLFTLLLAGRVCTANKISVERSENQNDVSTALLQLSEAEKGELVAENGKLAEKNEQLELEKNEYKKLAEQAKLEKEKNELEKNEYKKLAEQAKLEKEKHEREKSEYKKLAEQAKLEKEKFEREKNELAKKVENLEEKFTAEQESRRQWEENQRAQMEQLFQRIPLGTTEPPSLEADEEEKIVRDYEAAAAEEEEAAKHHHHPPVQDRPQQIRSRWGLTLCQKGWAWFSK